MIYPSIDFDKTVTDHTGFACSDIVVNGKVYGFCCNGHYRVRKDRFFVNFNPADKRLRDKLESRITEQQDKDGFVNMRGARRAAKRIVEDTHRAEHCNG